MATPFTRKYRIKFPSEKQASQNASDFIPYVSNIANMFMRTPNPKAPTLINPITNTRVSLADARRQVNDATRSADLSTQGLDAQTGAAVRVGNLATRLRSLSDLNSKEAQINAQTSNQANMVNANIEAQNAMITNQYQDDLTNAQLTRNRLASENISNAADKYIGQQAVKDQIQLDKDKANIYAKAFEPGVYNRLLKSLSQTGTDTSRLGTPKTNGLELPTPPLTEHVQAAPVTPSPIDQPDMNTIPTDIIDRMRKYIHQRNTYAAGGLLKVFAGGGPTSGDPIPKVEGTQNTAYNSNDMVFSDPITRNARMADLMNQIVAEGYHPYNSFEGKGTLSQIGAYFNPQFATDFTTRVMQLQGEPGYASMTPEQRLQRYYSMSKGGNSELDKFLTTTSSYGGSPSAFYQNTPIKVRAGGGSIHINPANRGKFTAAANRAGMGVQEYASHVLSNPNASPTLRKRANFARNAAKFHHAMGGKLIKPFC